RQWSTTYSVTGNGLSSIVVVNGDRITSARSAKSVKDIFDGKLCEIAVYPDISQGNRCRRTRRTPATRIFSPLTVAGTMGHHRSLLVSIRAFNSGFRSLILPIRTHSLI